MTDRGGGSAGVGPDDAAIERPVVSIITIFHNEEQFLPEAVGSVLAQVGPSWELLLVDDGSTDGSSSLARELAAGRPERIRYLTHDGGANRGMSASRNLGIESACGRWVTFLDADDMWLPGKLIGQLEELEAHRDLEVLVSPAQWWWSWDPSAARPDWDQQLVERPDRSSVVEPPTLLTRFLDDEWLSICDLMISRRALTRIGGYEPAFTGMFEDQVFHAKVFSQLAAVVTGESWYRYRQHPSACTATAHQTGQHLLARRAFIDWLHEYLAGDGATDQTLQRIVRRQRRPLHHPHLWRAGRLARRLGRVATSRGG